MLYLVSNHLLDEAEEDFVGGFRLSGPRSVVDAAQLLHLRREEAGAFGYDRVVLCRLTGSSRLPGRMRHGVGRRWIDGEINGSRPLLFRYYMYMS